MKKLLLFAISLLFVSVITAGPVTFHHQITDSKYIMGTDTLELSDTLGNIINNGILRVNSSNPDIEPLSGYIWIKNTTATEMPNIYVRRTLNQEVTGSINYFCFGINCYGPGTDESLYPVTIAAGATDKSFYGDYSPFGHGGLTSITYEFFDNLTFSAPVKAKATIEFAISATSLKEDKIIFKGPYPNPAAQYTSFEYNLPAAFSNAQLTIRNMLGVEVENIMIGNRSGKKSIDVSSYASGIYFYTFMVDGKVIQSKKMIVKH